MLKHQVSRTLSRVPSRTDSSLSPDSTDSGVGRSLRRTCRSTSVSSISSASTSGSNNETAADWRTVRVYTHHLRQDSDYKTLFVHSNVTARDLVDMVLAKFTKLRSKMKDPNLFYLTMEVSTKHEGRIFETVIPLDSTSKPLELQKYQPRDACRFVLQTRRGLHVRIHDCHINPGSNYKSLLISEFTTCTQVLQLLDEAHPFNWPIHKLQLAVVEKRSGFDTPLTHAQTLAAVFNQAWWDPQLYEIHIKPINRTAHANILSIPIIDDYAFDAFPPPSLSLNFIDSVVCEEIEEFCAV